MVAHVLDSHGARIAQGSGTVTMLTWKEGDPFLVDAEKNTCSASVEFKVQSDRNKVSQRGILMPVTVLTGQSAWNPKAVTVHTKSNTATQPLVQSTAFVCPNGYKDLDSAYCFHTGGASVISHCIAFYSM